MTDVKWDGVNRRSTNSRCWSNTTIRGVQRSSICGRVARTISTCARSWDDVGCHDLTPLRSINALISTPRQQGFKLSVTIVRMTDDRIYFDHAATTALRPEVQAAMLPFQVEYFGNASSLHTEGQAAHAALEEARTRILHCLQATDFRAVFTASGTEADNSALIGAVLAAREARVKQHAVRRRAILPSFAACALTNLYKLV